MAHPLDQFDWKCGENHSKYNMYALRFFSSKEARDEYARGLNAGLGLAPTSSPFGYVVRENNVDTPTETPYSAYFRFSDE